MTTESPDLTIHKTLHVDAPVERAFDVFTNGMPAWWPLATHSLGSGSVAIRWEVGGIAVEAAGDATHEWFDVVEYDPPHAVGMRWRVSPESPATDLRVTFAPEGDGTRVELTHSGWQAYGPNATESFGSYDEGWTTVLGHYVRSL